MDCQLVTYLPGPPFGRAASSLSKWRVDKNEDMAAPRYGGGCIVDRYEGENSQRWLEESRAERERAGLNLPSRVDQAGKRRGGGRAREEEKREDQEPRAEDQEEARKE